MTASDRFEAGDQVTWSFRGRVVRGRVATVTPDGEKVYVTPANRAGRAGGRWRRASTVRRVS